MRWLYAYAANKYAHYIDKFLFHLIILSFMLRLVQWAMGPLAFS